MENDWFYVSGTNELGPFSEERLRELLAGGEIGSDTMVRKRSWLDWKRAAAVELLSTARNWFFKIGDGVDGPITYTELRQKAAAEEIGADTPVRKGADGEWVAPKSCRGFFRGAILCPCLRHRLHDFRRCLRLCL